MDTDGKKVQQWQEAEALRRFRIIAPLPQDGLDDAEKIHLRKKLVEENHTTTRSIYRYEQMYRERQFEGLRPSERQKHRTQAAGTLRCEHHPDFGDGSPRRTGRPEKVNAGTPFVQCRMSFWFSRNQRAQRCIVSWQG